MTVIYRRFKEVDAKAVSEIVRRNFMEVNIKDYDEEAMKALYNIYDENKIKTIAGYGHMYIAESDGIVVATGSISSFWGSLEESILLLIFVLPELQGKGIGKSIMKTLEDDTLFSRARRIEIPSSITALDFYMKFGYDYKNGVKALDEEGYYRLEKYKKHEYLMNLKSESKEFNL